MESVVAFVVTPQKIERIELGALEPFTTAIDDYLRTLKRVQPVTGAKNDPGVFLRDKLWQPIAKQVAGAKFVLISPDGPLCRLPFAALPSADGKKILLEEHGSRFCRYRKCCRNCLAPRANRPADGCRACWRWETSISMGPGCQESYGSRHRAAATRTAKP